MKFLRLMTFALVSAALVSGAASAATLTFTNNGGDGYGVAVPKGKYDAALRMFSNNNHVAGIDTEWGGVAAPTVLLVTGKWRYVTGDARGSGADPLGFTINGVFTPFTAVMAAPGKQNGTFSFLVAKGSTFAWVLGSTDGRQGRGKAVIKTDIASAAVPLPAGGALLLVALGGLDALRRRKAA